MRHKDSHHTASLLTGLGLGVALMYFLDPAGGARRRSLVKDKAEQVYRRGRRIFQRRSEDLQNRAQGAVAEARGRMQEEQVEDETLRERVRSQLGHHTANAARLVVEAADGIVTLRGPIPREKEAEVVAAVRSVRGVEHVRNEMEPEEMPGDPVSTGY